jgi:hypothetical protein
MYRFFLIPDEGDAVLSLLKYRTAPRALEIGRALAHRILNPAADAREALRPELCELVAKKPTQIELVILKLGRHEVETPDGIHSELIHV